MIRDTVSADSSVPYTCSRWCRMSRTLIPCAYRLMIMSSRPPEIRPDRLGISTGSNVPARSRGTSQRHRPDPGLHRLGDRAVARVPAVMPGRLMPAIAQVRGQLGLQRPLQHRLDQLAQHRALTGQPQPPGLVPATAPAARPAAGHPSAPAAEHAAARQGGFPRRNEKGPPKTLQASAACTIPAGTRLLTCNGHDPFLPP